jgi:pimeloyl-ACP methyl ester carboxylesterase
MERTIQKSVRRTDGSWLSIDTYGDPTVPGLLVVPGVMSDARSWRHVALAMKAWPSISIINRRGRSPSGPLGEGYSLRTEVEDAQAALDVVGRPEALFGWSYGGLIALLLASERPFGQVIAYEPVDPTFGNAALPSLRAADAAHDWDRAVEIVNEQVSGFPAEYVEALRADHSAWSTLRRLSEPLYSELRALSSVEIGDGLGSQAKTIDLIIGERNLDAEPYGTSFQRVAAKVPTCTVHRLDSQGHLAHLEDPAALAFLLDGLAS